MADKIVKGISIAFDVDDVEFDKSIDSINKSLKSLKNQVKSYNKELKLDPSNTDVLKKKLENLSKQEELLKQQLKGYVNELNNLSDADVEGHSEKWMSLRDQIDKVQKSLKYVTEQEDKLNRMNPTLIKMGQSFKDISKELKTASEQTKELSVAGAAASAAIVKLTTDAAKNADDINTLAKQYNLSTKEIQQFSLASELIDVDLNTITKSYAKLTKNMTSSSKDVTGAFDKLNIKVKDSNGELRSSNDVFNEVILALSKIENETEQDSLAMSIFGKSAADLGPLINGGVEQLEAFNKYLEENKLLLSQDELDALNEYNDAIDMLKATFKTFTQKVAVTYAPMFQKALKKIQDVILRVKTVWEGLNPSIQKAIPIISGILGVLSPVLLVGSKITGVIGELATKLGMGDGLTGILGKLTSPLGIITAALAVLFAVSDDFRNSVKGLVSDLITGLQPVIEKVKDLIDILAEKFNTVILPILQDIGTFLAEHVVPIISNIATEVLPVVAEAIGIISSILSTLFDWLGKIWSYLNDVGVIDAFGKAFDSIGKFIENFIDKIKRAWEWVKKLIEKFKDWLDLGGGYEDVEGNRYTSYGRKLPTSSNSGGYGNYNSGGFGGITLNASFVANGNLDESQVLRFADLMTDRISNNLGLMMK